MSHRPIINVLTGKGPDLVNVVKVLFYWENVHLGRMSGSGGQTLAIPFKQ